MADINDLTDWDKIGICHATGGWYAVQYFKARYSIRKLEELGLVETMIEKAKGGPYNTVDIKLIRLTSSGLEMQAAIEASGFDKFAAAKRRA